MLCSSPLLHFSRHSFEPSQFRLKLLNHQTHHPHGLMVGMPDFLQNRAQRFLLSRHFLLQKFLPPPDLPLKYSWPCLPGEGHPSQKWRPVPLRRPFFAFQSIGQRRAPLRRGFKATPLRPCRLLAGLQRTNHSCPSQLFQRVVNLRPRNPRPIPYFAPLQFRIRLIPVHRPFRQQTKQHQIRSC